MQPFTHLKFNSVTYLGKCLKTKSDIILEYILCLFHALLEQLPCKVVAFFGDFDFPDCGAKILYFKHV